MDHNSPPPPFYILLSHTSPSTTASVPLPNTLQHPVIQFHYSDDSPLSLLPSHPTEHVVVFDYASGSDQTKESTVRSISKDLVVTGLKVEEAPGAAAGDDVAPKNDRMFIIETVDDQLVASAHPERPSAQQALARFKQRNSVLRSALQYPSEQTMSNNTPVSPQMSFSKFS